MRLKQLVDVFRILSVRENLEDCRIVLAVSTDAGELRKPHPDVLAAILGTDSSCCSLAETICRQMSMHLEGSEETLTHALILGPDRISFSINRPHKHKREPVKIVVQDTKVLLLLVAHTVDVHPPEIMENNQKVHHLESKGIVRDCLLPVDVVLETAIQPSALDR